MPFKWLIPTAAALVLAYLLLRPAQAAGLAPDYWSGAGDSNDSPDEPDQLPGLLESAAVTLNPISNTARGVPEGVAAANVRAMLDTIAWAEGTNGPDGYRTLFGGDLFEGYADHPRLLITRASNGREITSSAAGRYQILRRTWNALQRRLNLPDFSPASQDLAALELIRERGALGDVQAGRFADAVGKIKPVWASLPGAGYGQPERPLLQLAATFSQAGGVISA